MDLEQTHGSVLEDESEGLERFVGAQPAELALAPVEVGLEVLGELLADQAVDPVGAKNQIGIGEFVETLDLMLEIQADIQLVAAVLQDLQEFLARQSCETMAGGDDARALIVGLDLLPVAEVIGDLGKGLLVGLFEIGQGLIREDHSPTEGVVSSIALVDIDLEIGERPSSSGY